jgi:hypothetical protein
MRESLFNTEITNSLKANGWFAYKIPDTPTSMLVGLRYTPEKPCDIIASINGRFTAIECKQIKSIKCFSIKDFRDVQIESLDKVVSDGGRAWAFINLRVQKDKEFGRQNLLIGLDWRVWGFKLQSGFKFDAKLLRRLLHAYESNTLCDMLDELTYIVNISRGAKGLFDLRFMND